MITQIITDQFNDLRLDTMTVSGLSIAVFLVIYFFAKIKPAIDLKRRINRQATRRYENYVASIQARQKIADFNKKNPGNRKPNYQKQSLKKDKGYQAYLRRNAPKYMAAQDKKHASYLKLVSKNNQNKSFKTGGKGKFPVGFIGDMPTTKKPVNP